MVKIRRADYHPLEIVVKTTFILLIVGETNANSKLNLYDFSPSENKAESINSYGLSYIPFRYNQPAQSNKNDKSHRITFPDDDFISVRWQHNSLNCEDNLYCENPPYYPTELVKQVLLKNESLKNFGFVDSAGELTSRLDTNESPLCDAMPKLIYPKVMKNENNEQSFIVQDDELNMKQGVLIEKCSEEFKPCLVIGDQAPLEYVTKCKQKYVRRQLLTIRKDGVVARELFALPASCCCSITFNGRRNIA